MVRALEHPNSGAFDAKRIAGYSVALAFNALLLLLILVPMQGPQGLRVQRDAIPSITWYSPPPKSPPVVPVAPALPQPPQAPVRVERAATAEPPAPVLVEAGDPPPPATQPSAMADTPAVSIAPVVRPPLPGVRLEYLQAPAPEYPRAAARMRSEGTVLLQVLVDVDGRPLQVDVREGSGDRRLDEAARAQVLRRWRFRSAMQDGQAVQAIGLVPIEFKLR